MSRNYAWRMQIDIDIDVCVCTYLLMQDLVCIWKWSDPEEMGSHHTAHQVKVLL